MDRLGYDTMWLTEHHFQYEGYEVTPNLILFGLHLAKETERLRLGQMFNVVPQWHPLRLAEDAAMMQILTNNRMQFGVGRGTVPREAQSLGGVVASVTMRCLPSLIVSTARSSKNRWRSSKRLGTTSASRSPANISCASPRYSRPWFYCPRPHPYSEADRTYRCVAGGHLSCDTRVHGPRRTPRGHARPRHRKNKDMVGRVRRQAANEHGWELGQGDHRCLARSMLTLAGPPMRLETVHAMPMTNGSSPIAVRTIPQLLNA